MSRIRQSRKPKKEDVTRYVSEVKDAHCSEECLFVHFTGKIPSVNILTLDVHATKRRAPTTPVKVFKQSTMITLRNAMIQWRLVVPEFELYKLEFAFYFPCKNKNGSPRKVDTSNFVKIPEDAIASAIGIDDCRFIEVNALKQHRVTYEWSFRLTEGGSL